MVRWMVRCLSCIVFVKSFDKAGPMFASEGNLGRADKS
jgi:hypothetical protein